MNLVLMIAYLLGTLTGNDAKLQESQFFRKTKSKGK